jgi:site-specific DNA-methyltransferase (adenine-specific)
MAKLNFHLLPLSSITVGARFRKDQGDIDGLVESIRRFTLLHPLVLDRSNNLLAGGRRYLALSKIGLEKVPIHYLDELDEVSRREVELEENIARKNLTWQEQALLTSEIDSLKRELYGDHHGHRPVAEDNSPETSGWSDNKTAELRGVSRAEVRQDLALAKAIKALPSLANESSRTNALKKVDRLVEDLQREQERRKRSNEFSRFESFVKVGDATSLILDLPTHSVDCIITDPPYGVDVGHGGGHRMEAGFDDSPESALAILRSICPELRRVLKPSGHLYAFFNPCLWSQQIAIWQAAGFDCREVPNIWVKPGAATGTTDWDHNFAPAWEPFLFASNRERRLAYKRKNVFTYDVELGSARFHPTQKPLALLRELIQLSSDLGDLILDPFAGSGSTLVAASQLGRKYLGFELEPRFASIAVHRLANEGKELSDGSPASGEVLSSPESTEL